MASKVSVVNSQYIGTSRMTRARRKRPASPGLPKLSQVISAMMKPLTTKKISTPQCHQIGWNGTKPAASTGVLSTS